MQSEWRPGKWQLSGEAQRPGKPCAEFHNCPGDNRLDSVSSRKYHDNQLLLRKQAIFFSLEHRFQKSHLWKLFSIFHTPYSYLANLSCVLPIVFVISVSSKTQNIGPKQMLIFSLLGSNSNGHLTI